MKQIPLSQPFIEQDDIDAVEQVLRSGRLSLGPKKEEFEEALCQYTGRSYAIVTNSGTSALHLAMKCLRIGRGVKAPDTVIVPPFSFVASANCALYEGANVVFADIDKDLNIDPREVEKKISYSTTAIVAVDIFGWPSKKDELEEIADKHQLKLIEDSAEALGAEYRNRKVGSFGDVSIFAFYANKQITTGEGGCLLTDDVNIYRMAESYSNQGREKMGKHMRLGYNYRLDEMSCALGVTQLKKIDRILSMRRRVADLYQEYLWGVPVSIPTNRDSWFVYVIQTDRRDYLMEELTKRGIGCAPYFYPLHLMPHYKERGYRRGDFPVCEAVAKRTLALPFYTSMSAEDVEYVCHNIEEILR